MRLRAIGLALILGSTLIAGDQHSTAKPAQPVGTAVQDPQIDYFDSLSDYFRYSSQAVQSIYKQVGSPEETAAVLYLAKFSKLTANQVLAARKAGKQWADIAKEGTVAFEGDFVQFANASFLSGYHNRPMAELKRMHDGGATWVAINQEFRREGAPKQGSRARSNK